MIKKVFIVCNRCGTGFYRTPTNHLRGRECYRCTRFGYWDEKKLEEKYPEGITMYCVHLTDDVYKIGVTGRTIDDRFDKEEFDVTTMFEVHGDARIIKRLETACIKIAKEEFNGTIIFNPLNHGGDTECFACENDRIVNIVFELAELCTVDLGLSLRKYF